MEQLLSQESREAVVREAQEALRGRIRCFSRWTGDYGEPVDWHRNPVRGVSWPARVHWSRVLSAEPRCGDVKLTWEVNRFPHVFALVRAWALTGERRFIDGFCNQVREWEEANPYRGGVNWASGQELAIRCIAWAFALHTFGGDDTFREEEFRRLVRLLRLHGRNLAAHIARKHGFECASTDPDAILADEKVNTVFIATNHDSHASLVSRSLAARKHVFVEKPLAIDIAGLKQAVEAVRQHPDRHVMVGFNRRFSPHANRMKALLAGKSEPLAMAMTVNAGAIPPNVWVHDPEKGGGRIIGEACHFIDLMLYLAGSTVASVAAMQMGGQAPIKEDKMSILLSFADGSVGTVNYFANGNKAYPKESLEVFSDNRILKLDNFRTVAGYGFQGFRKFGTWRMDKGHQAEVTAFVAAVEKGGATPIPFPEIVNVTLASFAAVTSAREGRRIELEKEYGDLAHRPE